MKTIRLKIPLIIAVLLFSLTLFSNLVLAENYTVQGLIVKAPNNTPIPGLTVSLIHSALGRSVPATTDQFGRYVFYNIPARQEPYYMEIYWGKQLVYRDEIIVNGPTSIPTIIL